MNKTIIIGLSILMILSIGCEPLIDEGEMVCDFEEEVILYVGQEKLVDGQFLMYHGMISDSVFAISHTGRTANNVFYPTNITRFNLYGHKLELRAITREGIIISYEGDNCNTHT